MIKKVIVFCVFLVPFSSQAFIPGSDRFELGFGAEFPVQTGLQARINLDTNFYLRAGAGFAIKPFMISYKEIGKNLDISERMLDLVTTALTNSVVFNGRIGVTMSVYEGPYMEFGYNVMTWGSGEVTGRLIQNSFGSLGNDSSLSDNSVYHVNITNHGPTFHLGYRFILIDKLSMNMELGVYKPVSIRVNWDGGHILSTRNKEELRDFIFNKMWLFSVGLWINFSF